MESPNLFAFASSELSQDAFICWLASWAKPSCQAIDGPLHKTATFFLDRLLEVGKGPKVSEYKSVEVRTQDNDIDVLLLVNNEIAIIIEDKINAKDHSGQLQRYKEAVQCQFPKHVIAAVYFKTGDQCDYRSAEQAGYGCFLRRDFLKILEQGNELVKVNNIFADYYRHLKSIEEAVRSYLDVPPKEWNPKQWIGFFIALRERLGFGEWEPRGHPGGSSVLFRVWREDKFVLLTDNGKLRFKIEVMNKIERKAKWMEWNQMLMSKNGTAGINVITSPFRRGKRMTVAVLDQDYRQLDDRKLLDMTRTVEMVSRSVALVDVALGVKEQGTVGSGQQLDIRDDCKSTGWHWQEGQVDPEAPHIELYYGENSEPGILVALVAEPVGKTFVVEVVPLPELDKNQCEKIKRTVINELNFYLVELRNEDPWQYAIYHCTTASNIYSDVHWGFYPGCVPRTPG